MEENLITPKLFTETDKVYIPVKPISEYSEDEQKEAVTKYWPESLKNILAITIDDMRYERLVQNSGVLSQYVQKIQGINGRLLPTLEELQEQKIYEPVNKWNPMTRGQIGCFMSHRKAWQHVVDHKLPFALIIEDDCDLLPHPDTLKYIGEVFRNEINFTWDLLYLGRNPAYCTKKLQVRPHVVTVGKTWGLFAYAVSLHGAEQLLKETSGPIKEPVDVCVSITKHLKRKIAFSPIAIFIRTEESSDTSDIK
jgi:GR25 family glycosyltransferase involved in LPS biosynthesis